MTGENPIYRLEFQQKDMIPLHRHYLIIFFSNNKPQLSLKSKKNTNE